MSGNNESAAGKEHEEHALGKMASIHQVPSHISADSRSVNERGNSDASSTRNGDIEKDAGSSLTKAEENPEEEPERDPNIVDFDGPDDPEDPMNWSNTKKWGTVLLVSAITFLTPLASSNFAPGVPEIMAEFHSTSRLLASFMVSVFVLGFAVGPLLIAPLSEMYGRLPMYHACNLLFVIFTVAAAVSNSMAQFIIFRFLMGCWGGGPMVLGGGTIADLIPHRHRGTAMGIWMMGVTIGPCVGPIIGGYLGEARGWRWNFWFVAIVAGAFFVISLIMMKETSPVIILERKTKRLRAETGNDKLRSKLASDMSTARLLKHSLIRPAKMLFRSTICFALSLYVAITYAYLYILFTTFSVVYSEVYGWNGGNAGLAFVGIGVGSIIGQITYVRLGNYLVNKHIKRGDFKPEHRLYIMTMGGIWLPLGLFMYGWGTHYGVHYIVPQIATAFVGFGLLLIFMPASTYLVDVYTVHAASAMTAMTVLRSLMAAFVPLSSRAMYDAMGYGWGNSLLGFVSLALVPIPFLFIKYGEGIRARSTVKL
ncbi:hypothetical protein IAQ61_010236 [Plenodomus lingam]|nr:hypothetical protein IAQ61_010236 [Plenodomus lingam]